MNSTEVISYIAIIISTVTLITQIWQNRQNNIIVSKNQFTVCTARYAKIQELLLSKDGLNDLNVAIYKDKLSAISKDEANVWCRELAMCSMMFQLMEDVWLMHDLDKSKSGKHYDQISGWEILFKDWMSTAEIIEKWHILKNHYGRNFITHVEDRYLNKKGVDQNDMNLCLKASR